MKKLTLIYSVTALLLIVFVVISARKKKTEATVGIDPTFDVTVTAVQLQAGGEGLQFYAPSTNVDIKMTSVVIEDPNNSPPDTYNFNGLVFSKNQSFDLRETSAAYI
jgi:hypothetical protein